VLFFLCAKRKLCDREEYILGARALIKGYNPVNWFEIPVKNITRAKEFYESVLGYPLNENDIG